MLFTNLGRFAAILALILGLLRLTMGLSIATGVVIEPEPGAYLGSKTSGQVIDHGIYALLFAIVIGILTEISRSIAKSNRTATT